MVNLIMSTHYRYRQRDEVVNERFLVEEIYGRERLTWQNSMRKRTMKTRFSSPQLVPIDYMKQQTNNSQH